MAYRKLAMHLSNSLFELLSSQDIILEGDLTLLHRGAVECHATCSELFAAAELSLARGSGDGGLVLLTLGNKFGAVASSASADFVGSRVLEQRRT